MADTVMPFGRLGLAGWLVFGGLAAVLSGTRAGKPVFAWPIDPAAHCSGHVWSRALRENRIESGSPLTKRASNADI